MPKINEPFAWMATWLMVATPIFSLWMNKIPHEMVDRVCKLAIVVVTLAFLILAGIYVGENPAGDYTTVLADGDNLAPWIRNVYVYIWYALSVLAMLLLGMAKFNVVHSALKSITHVQQPEFTKICTGAAILSYFSGFWLVSLTSHLKFVSLIEDPDDSAADWIREAMSPWNHVAVAATAVTIACMVLALMTEPNELAKLEENGEMYVGNKGPRLLVGFSANMVVANVFLFMSFAVEFFGDFARVGAFAFSMLAVVFILTGWSRDIRTWFEHTVIATVVLFTQWFFFPAIGQNRFAEFIVPTTGATAERRFLSFWMDWGVAVQQYTDAFIGATANTFASFALIFATFELVRLVLPKFYQTAA
jgi:hypothetical protein